MAPPPDPDRERTPAPRPRRSYSLWTILAPIGALVLFIAFFHALGDSCLLKECVHTKDEAKAAGPANKLASGARAKVKSGDTLGSLAERFHLSQDELIACNPDVDAQTLQPGAYLNVSAMDCEGQDRAATGANPDPLAGETSAIKTKPGGANDPTNNGTAAADPSARQNEAATPAKDDKGTAGTTTDETSAESGDEG